MLGEREDITKPTQDTHLKALIHSKHLIARCSIPSNHWIPTDRPYMVKKSRQVSRKIFERMDD
jgi:hypothetical protein